jgi:hypothetical protein
VRTEGRWNWLKIVSNYGLWFSSVKPLGFGNTVLVVLSVQIGSGAHPAFYPVSTRALSPGVKRQERETDHLPPPSTEIKNGWSCTSTLPMHIHGVVLS